jgi:predicted esterase
MGSKIFIHGLESGNKGTKSVFFREKFPDMIIPDFKGDLPARMEKLHQVLEGKSDICIVGSSFGGLMAVLFAMQEESRVKRMVLLAPALNHLKSAVKEIRTISLPVVMYHGRNDEVIPLDEVETVAKKTFKSISLYVVDDDHFLHNTFKDIEWELLLD